MASGTELVGGRIPGELVGTSTATANSGTFTTTETVVMTTVASVVQGRTYRVWFYGALSSSVAADAIACRIREDGVAGTELQLRLHVVQSGSGTSGVPTPLEGRYVADVTEAKTFVVTGQRASGSGNINLRAAGTFPCLLDVYYKSG